MNKKSRLKIGIIITIITISYFSNLSFAEDSSDDGIKMFGLSLDFIVNVLAWIWVFFANIAGQFLTNKWIYGEILGFDALLWKFWNIVKNFANFGLGFYFIYIIFKGLISQIGGKEDITKKLKDMILWLLIAGIGIQCSRFLTAVVIDTSSITLAAVGSFPSQLISQDAYSEEKMEESIKGILADGGQSISLFPNDAGASSLLRILPINVEESAKEGVLTGGKTKLLDALLPNQNNVSGPLYFMGFSLLNTNKIPSWDTSSPESIKYYIFNALIQGGTTILYSIEMIMLCIVALMRVVYLWMFIVLSPIVVLLKCLEKSGDKDLINSGVVKSLSKEISLKTFFVNTFKPTFIVLGIGIAMIFTTLMNGIIHDSVGGPISISGAIFESRENPTSSIGEGDKRYISVIDSSLFKFISMDIGKTFLELIFSIIIVILVYYIIRTAMKIGGGDDFISKKIGGLTDSFESLVTKVPMVPVPGYDANGVPKNTYMSLGSISKIPQTYIDNKTNKVREVSSAQTDRVMEMWGVNSKNSLTATEENKIKTIMNNNSVNSMIRLDDVKKYINSIQTEEGKGMKLNPQTASNNGLWINEFTNWLNNAKTSSLSGDWKNMVSDWQGKSISKRNLEFLFNNGSYATAYANHFGYTGIYNNFDDIKNLDISKKH